MGLVVVSISKQKKYCRFVSKLNSSALLIRSLPSRRAKKELARGDVFDTFANRVGLVHGVIDTDCCAQNGSSHGCVSATTKR